MAHEPADDAGVLPAAPVRPTSTSRVRVLNVEDGVRRRRADRLATEEPMEIRVDEPGGDQRTIAVTMRTPGHDFELAVGFLLTEGLIGPGDSPSISTRSRTRSPGSEGPRTRFTSRA